MIMFYPIRQFLTLFSVKTTIVKDNKEGPIKLLSSFLISCCLFECF